MIILINALIDALFKRSEDTLARRNARQWRQRTRTSLLCFQLRSLFFSVSAAVLCVVLLRWSSHSS